MAVFDAPEALALNRARLAHIESLHLDIRGRSVLDVGAGLGYLAQFFAERDCRVVCTEGREENVQALRKRYPAVQAHVADIETDSLARFGRFDIVLCYGLLYHLANPVAAIRNMAAVCDELLLVETVIVDRAEPVLPLVDEPVETPNQALGGLGCRPSPGFVAVALTRSGFPYVYAPTRPPEHPDFQFGWKNSLEFSRDGRLLRCSLVASRGKLDNPELHLFLVPPQTPAEGRFRPVERSAAPERIWLDVGAHLGENTFQHARDNPRLRVYAFEPNLAVASQGMGILPNFVVVPMVVTETDGAAGIDNVDYLKIDVQGADLAVLRSAGPRLKDIRCVSLEVQTTPLPLYAGASGKSAILQFMAEAGFCLIAEETQSRGQEVNLTFVRGERPDTA